MNDAAVRADFEPFAREHWATLMSIGVAVCGSRAEAEDLRADGADRAPS